ncbi:CcmF/CcyK/CcsA family cytochrome c biogenesis protein [Anaplasma phagocytophilum str. CRT38]|uniref:CcmF/CcyK/CcsA family cytochrome c biogenesis protein n=2 Tax=Anaplasma phagocytophilum TaxID=948 RepID=S6GB16_ANAPH|nr:CcmF/CcyK/CcsA family cytochrome c biogenesis protein [Anaplasma phagocytophilum str. CRT38]
MQYFVDGFVAFLILPCILSLLYPVSVRLSAALGAYMSYAVAGLLSASVGFLIYLRIVDDFSFENVFNNSHSLQPILYKITGVWGNYEGSYLLFLCLLSVYTAIMEFAHKKADNLKRIALTAQHLMLGGFTAFGAIFANPFLRVFSLTEDGLGFNPLLQDIGLTIHPPILFSGYTGLAPVLSITIAALILNYDPVEWAKIIRVWVLNAWSFLTLGVALGGWWAYRVLGWGGFWAWDPVENVVLLPWLLSTALIHMLPIVRKSRVYCNFTYFLAVSTFLSSLYSTFLVRSGLLISVHTFAFDDTRGVFILVFISVIVLICYTIFIMYCIKRDESCDFRYASKITLLLGLAVLLLIAFSTIITGTVYPILWEFFTGETISVGYPYYSNIFSVLHTVLLCMLIVLPCIGWDGYKTFKLSFKISTVFAAILSPLAIYYGISGILILLACFLFSSIIEDFFSKLHDPLSWTAIRSALRPGRCAMLSGHLGVAILTAGIIYSSTYQAESYQYMKVGDTISVHDFQAVFEDISIISQEYYDALVGRFSITKADSPKVLHTLFPENRFYHVEGTRNVISSTYHGFLADIYMVIGDTDLEKGISVQMRYKPLISLVWIGCIMLVIGGIFGIYNAWLKIRPQRKRNAL